jgi:AcrR family transcriptional regulator
MARASAEERKLMIIKAVLDVFRQKGISASSTRDVAEKTGLARSHIYHYFKDWRELSIVAVEYFSYNEINELQQRLEPLPAPNALSTFIWDYLPSQQDASWCIYLDAWNESLRDPVFAESYHKIIVAWRRLLEQILQKGIDHGDFNNALDANKLARQISALVNGYADELILDPSPTSTKQAFQDIMETVTKLLR